MSDNTGQSRIPRKDTERERLLVFRAKQGEEPAFGQIYELYFEKIFKFIFFRVNHKELAEDLTEEVFIKAWTKISSVKEESFNGWLYQIAKNLIIDHYRQKRELVNLEDVSNILESEENLNEDANTIIERKIFLELLKKLTPEQQIVVKLKFMEEMDNDEISELISRTEGSIRVTQHRAIQKLQELFLEYKEQQLKSPSQQPKNAITN